MNPYSSPTAKNLPHPGRSATLTPRRAAWGIAAMLLAFAALANPAPEWACHLSNSLSIQQASAMNQILRWFAPPKQGNIIPNPKPGSHSL